MKTPVFPFYAMTPRGNTRNLTSIERFRVLIDGCKRHGREVDEIIKAWAGDHGGRK